MEVDQLRQEQIVGARAERAYEEFIKHFINERRKELFNAFQVESVTNPDNLMEIKRMTMALSALEQEILTIIQTGQLASTSLKKMETH